MATRDTAIAKPPSRLREPIVSSAAPGGALQDIAAPRPRFKFMEIQLLRLLPRRYTVVTSAPFLEIRCTWPRACSQALG
jgi:hypothetical protein